ASCAFRALDAGPAVSSRLRPDAVGCCPQKCWTNMLGFLLFCRKVRIICNGIFLVNVCNNIHHPSIMNRVVTHELIHAFDHCRAHVDWFRNIKHLACSEIRAANLSGDCSFINEVRRFKFGFKQHRQACIRDGAIRSILAVRKVDRETAEKAVDEVFNSCFNDHEPYGRVPHNSKEAKYAYRDFQNRDRYYANL
uniref:Mitochondrial inner membrane protease ATP23 n=1 Tax=Sphenodon punctatus TaxID=8508 RepID=A0A8D0GLS4_SPHPU